ncbi:MAG: T9SS type A sorting domain-containing protein, partial [Chitinophagaceae bacterium]|nr:T9SS type A sorting domain-containing protein [Chitinophagaceae bacterium]
TVTSAVAYCQGETASVLTASGSSLKWYTVLSGGTALATAPTPSTASPGTTIYYVSQSNAASIGGCESARASIAVTINSLPVAPTVTSAVAYCQGATASVLTAIGTSLKWYTVSSGGTALASAPTPSTSSIGTSNYYVSQTSAASVGGCEGTRSAINVLINPLPTAPGVASPLNLCMGTAESSLTAMGSNLKWYSAATGGTGSITAPTPSTASLSTNTYYVSQTSSASVGGCEGPRAALLVQVQPLPSVTISSLSSTGFIYCRESNISLKANAPLAATYQWSFGGTNIAGLLSDTTIAANSGMYKVLVKTAYGCEGIDSINVTKDSSIIPTLSPTEIIICEEGSQLLTVNPGFVGWTFEWKKDGITFAAPDYINLKNVNLLGTYTVISKNTVGCIDTTNEAHLGFYPKPTKPTIINMDPILEIPNVYLHYQWYRNGVKIISTNVSLYTTMSPGSYHVEVTDENGCLNQSDTVEIKSATGINTSVLKSVLKIYPNPSRNIVYIEAPIKVNVKVTDITGRMIIALKEAKEIDLGNYADGNYILMITDEENNLITVEKISKMQ